MADDKPCPSCGYCPTCGRGPAHQMIPWYQPVYHPWSPAPTWTWPTITSGRIDVTSGGSLSAWNVSA